ncbi:hypothetical protein [Streptomyces vilmorinianum]|uniref:hypothetical protein n=1 Tax=Streptomyces vilmorinianum TaxID=3051092 RepID=UPI001585E687|nr:hypothetical protein [Streptomyces vilmorinianum]
MTARAASVLTASGCELLEAGAAWDAVRVPRELGLVALEILGSRSGSVVEDPAEAALYWFVQAGSTDVWDIEHARVLSVGHTVAVPPARRTSGPGPRWLVCPGEESFLTDTGALQAALADSHRLAENLHETPATADTVPGHGQR